MRLLLSGGGRDVPAVDAFFAARIDTARPVLYIPVAQDESERTHADRLAWFEAAYGRYGIAHVAMCTDLRGAVLTDEYAAVYLGGGNTYSLLAQLRESGFDRQLAAYLRRGGFVYGSSAGSIVFGRDIAPTTYEDENEIGLADSAGLNLAGGYDICCHFGDAQRRAYKRARLAAFAGQSKGTIALPDDCAIYIEDDGITCLGSGVVLITP